MQNKPTRATGCTNNFDCRNCKAVVSCPIPAAANVYAKSAERRTTIAAELGFDMRELSTGDMAESSRKGADDARRDIENEMKGSD